MVRLPTPRSQINKRTSSDVLDLCLDNNVLHFDLAERYPFPEQKETVGESEKIFGTWVKRKDREKIYIGTKVTGRNSEGWFGEDAERLTYNRIRTAVQSSLKRLNTDYIDIFFFIGLTDLQIILVVFIMNQNQTLDLSRLKNNSQLW